MANLAANSFIGNNTGAGATPIAMTAAQAKTLLAIAQGDVSGLTAAAVRRCAGQTACAITLDDLAALRHGPLGAATVQIHWRCEGEMAKRESVVSAGHTTRLACE